MSKRKTNRILAAVALAGVVGAIASVPAARDVAARQAIGAFPSIFSTRTTRSSNIEMFPKWGGALIRYFNERQLADAPCTSTVFNKCHLQEWEAFLETLKGKDRLTQLREVNAYMNRQRYLTDPRNYGVKDYWATPAQFFRRDGDCEDYAIAKFISLRTLGFTNAEMRVVVLRDLNLKVGHAILVVNLDGQALVLDNQVKSVVRAEAIRHYRPIYSINEKHWWLHRRG